jgi:hypothetical protein
MCNIGRSGCKKQPLLRGEAAKDVDLIEENLIGIAKQLVIVDDLVEHVVPAMEAVVALIIRGHVRDSAVRSVSVRSHAAYTVADTW